MDFTELASGISVLCGGARDQKVLAAFQLYDYNGDGYISEDEFARYLASVFKVLYAVSPGLAETVGADAATLARETAGEAFADADLNRDGMLSFAEFTKWYTNNDPNPENYPDLPPQPPAEDAPNPEELHRFRTNSMLEDHHISTIADLYSRVANGGFVAESDFFRATESLLNPEHLTDQETVTELQVRSADPPPHTHTHT